MRVLGRSSFENLQKWLDFISEQRGNDILIVLVANKLDLKERR
jgi:GTPase SAR1 family protein